MFEQFKRRLAGEDAAVSCVETIKEGLERVAAGEKVLVSCRRAAMTIRSH